MSGNSYNQANRGNKIDPSSTNPPPSNYVPNTHRLETGPAPTTAGPHQSDIANKLDPRVDSDLNNRAQYAPGTTTTNNTHPGATRYISHPDSKNDGPHSSSILNKLDPRVNSKTGETTTMTTNAGGTGPTRQPVQQGSNVVGPQSNVVPGSSTEAPAAPNAASASTYNRDAPQNYNPAVGTGYNPGPNTGDASYQGAAPAGSSTTTTTTSGNQGRTGGGLKSAIAGMHGVGESLRGTINAAVDRSFGDKEGERKNEAIATEGEYQVNSGNFARSTKEREGLDVNRRNQRA